MIRPLIRSARLCEMFQICAPNLRILNVDASYPGSRHDAAIWRASAARQYMERWYQRGERGTWLLGDSGYPLEPWLMTPITDAEEWTPEADYTEAHCKARSPIERCNGVLKMVFRCLCEVSCTFVCQLLAAQFKDTLCTTQITSNYSSSLF